MPGTNEKRIAICIALAHSRYVLSLLLVPLDSFNSHALECGARGWCPCGRENDENSVANDLLQNLAVVIVPRQNFDAPLFIGGRIA